MGRTAKRRCSARSSGSRRSSFSDVFLANVFLAQQPPPAVPLSAVVTGEGVVPASAGCNFEKRWSWPRALPLYLTTLTLTPRGSLSAPLKAPVHSMPEGIAESPTTIAPIKTGLAFFVSGLLQRIESLDIVDYTSDALRELPHGFKG